MLFIKRIQRHGRGAGHLDGAEIAIIFIAADAQNITCFKMRLAFIAKGNGLTPGQNVILKALKKSDVVWLHGMIP